MTFEEDCKAFDEKHDVKTWKEITKGYFFLGEILKKHYQNKFFAYIKSKGKTSTLILVMCERNNHVVISHATYKVPRLGHDYSGGLEAKKYLATKIDSFLVAEYI